MLRPYWTDSPSVVPFYGYVTLHMSAEYCMSWQCINGNWTIITSRWKNVKDQLIVPNKGSSVIRKERKYDPPSAKLR